MSKLAVVIASLVSAVLLSGMALGSTPGGSTQAWDIPACWHVVVYTPVTPTNPYVDACTPIGNVG